MFGLNKKREEAAEALAASQYISKEVELYKNTPDVAALERKPFHRVFLYDVMMRGHYKHDEMIVEGCEYRCNAFTEDRFTLWKKNLGKLSYPIALKDKFASVPSRHIKGELYKLPTERLFEIDKALENTVSFERVRVPVVIPCRPVLMRYLKTPRVVAMREPKDGEAQMEPVTSSWEHELGPENTMTVEVWMYVGKSDYWSPLLDGGYIFQPVHRFENKTLGEYYHYSQLEYNEYDK